MTDFAARRTMMVDTQVRPSDVTKFPIIDAMLSVPREDFVPDAKREAAYMGENIDLGGGRVVLEPRTLAKMLDALDIQSDELVLDLGCGLGYSAAVLARLADFVVAVESDESMASDAQSNLSEFGADNVAVIQGEPSEGNAKNGPYDVIIVQGAVEQVPDALLEQLKDGGRITAIFADGKLGTVRIGYKMDGSIVWRHAFNAGAPVVSGFEAVRAFVL
ncbi:protein-L-isoaspartate O-methyltransferase [Aliiroseovarius crassostreae]|uniref:Protein-L-isoaspartate O-methyltransferase n=1 Tax=Aliiroseovarius crassostreae TaxID=154981 RepID=A0A9Q9H9N5_9RHOB|nr:protein-L-isoaspartate O-methyltransferase [Aliiroseovarius crassostreae]UWP93001.1 protein-L-isoaspartate O-methyltransferase [Aliiroseovarius crassostreae]UWP96129.1 protein-L-isoaspartate O-methyltransferase [Aliiroseovarius crassostreae]UWP99299.1 protein-L-isoaspartate O-methyltransferase [Aliiroseovarius crassostreae]UWQ03779.1 protein-L-isoaspartate O-methyltransferase [Aliiroseovarius crassostreae]UWQ08776.1 protein-L-isoaspartate O-methyltransferase [Aliiroseovarius crassostreae]